ncbi:MAG: hypothetical protein KA327_11240, partial [Pseudarcicella sp.]|nr:hypothetical protein [Pseudarcicella sp.]
MKSKLLITIFLLTPFLHLAQIKDSTFRNHLIVKFAPLTMFGLNSAVQLGLETNYSKNKSICLDYAFGGNKTGKDFFGLEIEGLGKETSQRLKLEHRWYLRDRYKRYNTSSQNPFLNKIFIGLELAYKNVKYQKEVDLGHGNYTIRNLEVQEFDY